MKYQQLMKQYYGDLSNLNQLLQSMVNSYRLLIAGAAELNNINEARSSYVKVAVKRADNLGEIIDHVIELLDECGESYFKYIALVGDHILKNTDSSVILTEVDNELLFQDASVREEYEALKKYKEEDFFYNNNDIEIELSNGQYLKYKVFSVYITDINDNYTKTSFEDKDEYKEFLERIKNKSIYKSDISVNENDKIITLSTCSYEFDDARLVVTGKLIDKEQ